MKRSVEGGGEGNWFEEGGEGEGRRRGSECGGLERLEVARRG